MDKTPGKVHSTVLSSEVCGEDFEVQYYLPKSYSDLYKYNVIITFPVLQIKYPNSREDKNIFKEAIIWQT